jgi:hypothetical protein
VIGFFSSRPNWDPLTSRRVCSPSGGTLSLAGEGVGGPNSDEGTDTGTLGIYVLCGQEDCSQ